MSDKPEPRLNGCHNRAPFVFEYPLTGGGMQANFSAGKPCEYTKSNLGRVDVGCSGCAWAAPQPTPIKPDKREKTGWPPGMLQDDDRKLSKWLASRMDAWHVVRQGVKE